MAPNGQKKKTHNSGCSIVQTLVIELGVEVAQGRMLCEKGRYTTRRLKELSWNLGGSADGRDSDGRDGRGISNTQTFWESLHFPILNEMRRVT
jgi:hypothetical protein